MLLAYLEGTLRRNPTRIPTLSAKHTKPKPRTIRIKESLVLSLQPSAEGCSSMLFFLSLVRLGYAHRVACLLDVCCGFCFYAVGVL